MPRGCMNGSVPPSLQHRWLLLARDSHSTNGHARRHLRPPRRGPRADAAQCLVELAHAAARAQQ
eukprot:2161809-Prymnesium_polylepis.1